MSKVAYKCLFVLLLCFFALCANGQELQVKSFGFTSESVYASTHPVMHDGKPCAMLRVQIPRSNVTFEGEYLIEQKKVGPSEYHLYMADGAKMVTVNVPGFLPMLIKFPEYNREDYVLRSKQDYLLVIVVSGQPARNSISSSFYVEAGAMLGSPMGADFSAGAYIADFNIELGATMPFGASEQVYWNHSSQDSQLCTYKPSFSFSGRLGYGIRLGESLRLTPQLGMRFLKTGESNESGSVQHADGANVTSLLLAFKLQYMLGKHFGISLTPEYDAAILKSDGFKALSDASPEIGKWNNGVGVKLAIQIAF